MNSQSLNRGLAWLSFGLGFAGLFAPRRVGALVGVQGYDNLIRALGVREIGSGLGLMQGNPGAFLWSRVAGDAMDLALLCAARRCGRHDTRRIDRALWVVAGTTALDVFASVLHNRCTRGEAEWRDHRPLADRAGIAAGDPHALRASTDQAMTRFRPAPPAIEEEPAAEPVSPIGTVIP